MNVFITGVSKGIGLALTEMALKANHSVLGVARKPSESKQLMNLKKEFPSLSILELDLMEENALLKITEALKDFPHIDLVINNAGVYEKGSSKAEFLKTFEVNTFIPFMVSAALLPKLKKSSTPKLTHISSIMGSIEDNTSGGSYFYRSSKTALNMIHKCLTLENPWLCTLVLHPGWVQTDMGGSQASVTVEDSAKGLWKVITTLSPEQSGGFKTYQGEDLPW